MSVIEREQGKIKYWHNKGLDFVGLTSRGGRKLHSKLAGEVPQVFYFMAIGFELGKSRFSARWAFNTWSKSYESNALFDIRRKL